VAAEAI